MKWEVGNEFLLLTKELFVFDRCQYVLVSFFIGVVLGRSTTLQVIATHPRRFSQYKLDLTSLRKKLEKQKSLVKPKGGYSQKRKAKPLIQSNYKCTKFTKNLKQQKLNTNDSLLILIKCLDVSSKSQAIKQNSRVPCAHLKKFCTAGKSTHYSIQRIGIQ